MRRAEEQRRAELRHQLCTQLLVLGTVLFQYSNLFQFLVQSQYKFPPHTFHQGCVFPGLQCHNTAQYSNLEIIIIIMKLQLYLYCYIRKNSHCNYISRKSEEKLSLYISRKSEEKLSLQLTNFKKEDWRQDLLILKHSGSQFIQQLCTQLVLGPGTCYQVPLVQ